MPFSNYQYARFVSAVVPNAQTTMYTVPASTQVLVKDILLTNVTGAAVTMTIFQMPAPIATMQGAIIPGNNSLHWTGLIVLNAGEIISMQASAASSVYATISGQTGV